MRLLNLKANLLLLLKQSLLFARVFLLLSSLLRPLLALKFLAQLLLPLLVIIAPTASTLGAAARAILLLTLLLGLVQLIKGGLADKDILFSKCIDLFVIKALSQQLLDNIVQCKILSLAVTSELQQRCQRPLGSQTLQQTRRVQLTR